MPAGLLRLVAFYAVVAVTCTAFSASFPAAAAMPTGVGTDTLRRSVNGTDVSDAFGQKGSKVCIAWGNSDSDSSLANFKTSHVVGLYDWSVDKPAAANALGFDYWPMLWGGDQAHIDAFESAVTQGFGTIILGFNEPNEVGQSNLDPNTAAALWKEYIEPKRSLGYKTCSPAVSAATNGQQWMRSFMQACSGCTIDYQCLHWYGLGASNLQAYLEEYHDTFNLPILLTEFADEDFSGANPPTLNDVIVFMQQSLAFFDNTGWMLAACPFDVARSTSGAGNPSALQNADGTPTELGSIVINDEY
ncbi:glycosyl hydrolase catalytic core-domain-containing protein [Cubamyces lactineus]|nr:glycosyl hydrolase catalytic core-domain-containing protein [Cubamyces lactineus]